MSDSFATLWTVALQDPLSMKFSRQEYWNGLLFPSPLLYYIILCYIVKVKVQSLSCVRFFVNPWTVAYQAPGPQNFPGKSTGEGCHFLVQRAITTQGSNPGFLHCRQILYQLSHQGSPNHLYFQR